MLHEKTPCETWESCHKEQAQADRKEFPTLRKDITNHAFQ
jgi:hypothetical protein